MTKKRKLGALYFTDVNRVDKDGVVVIGNYYALEGAEEERTALLSLRGGVWGGMDLSGIAHAVRYRGETHDLNKQYLVLERNKGLYMVTPPNNVRFVKVNDTRDGFLMDLRQIGERWYAVGGHHQIYREENGKWESIDSGVYIPGDAGEAKILLSIDGNSEKDIYAVGFNGVVLHYDGITWKQLDSPTDYGFQRVLCVSEDEVYLCGYGNSLYRLNKDSWIALTEPDDAVVFWDMRYFQGKLYVCTKKKLFILEHNQLEEVIIPVKGPLGFYRMDSDENELWTCGNECLLQFDGKNWKQFVFPDNE